MPEVWIPPRMQALTGGKQQVQVAGRTVRQVMNNLDQEFPGIKEYLYDAEEDDLVAGIAVIVDGEVSQLGLLERVGENSEVHFLPAIGGGDDTLPVLGVIGDELGVVFQKRWNEDAPGERCGIAKRRAGRFWIDVSRLEPVVADTAWVCGRDEPFSNAGVGGA